MAWLPSFLAPPITQQIRLDHAHVQAMFHRVRPELAASRKQGLGQMICIALQVHAQLEEELFYPALRALASDIELLRKSVPEHDEMRRLIAELQRLDVRDPVWDATLLELMRDVVHHVADEETTLLPAAERLLAHELRTLGARMAERRAVLLGLRAASLASSAAAAWPDSLVLLAGATVAVPAYLARRSR